MVQDWNSLRNDDPKATTSLPKNQKSHWCFHPEFSHAKLSQCVKTSHERCWQSICLWKDHKISLRREQQSHSRLWFFFHFWLFLHALIWGEFCDQIALKQFLCVNFISMQHHEILQWRNLHHQCVMFFLFLQFSWPHWQSRQHKVSRNIIMWSLSIDGWCTCLLQRSGNLTHKKHIGCQDDWADVIKRLDVTVIWLMLLSHQHQFFKKLSLTDLTMRCQRRPPHAMICWQCFCNIKPSCYFLVVATKSFHCAEHWSKQQQKWRVHGPSDCAKNWDHKNICAMTKSFCRSS